MKALASKRMRCWLGGAGLLAILSWHGLGSVTGTRATALTGNVTVYGQVAKQGAYTWHQGMTARELISDAGGPTPFARIKKVTVLDPNAPGHVRWWRKTMGWLATAVDGANDWVDSAWEACSFPGASPHFRMRAPSNVKATLNLRQPASDVALSPGDVVIVEEILVNF